MSDFTFEGFTVPEKNYFHMPNEWIDICAEIRDISELKVIQYVIRHTWGFREYGICKVISVDEFRQGRRRQDGSRMDKGTGLSEQSVRNGLKKAIDDGYLVFEIDTSDAARTKKSYALKMRTEVETRVQTLDPPQTLDPVQTLGSEVQTLDPRGINFRPRSEKDTIEKHLEKDTIDNSCDDANASITQDVQTSQSNVSQDDEEEAKKRADFMKFVHEIVAQANDGTRTRSKTVKVTVPKPKTVKPEPTPEEQAFQARCTALQAQIIEWRGYPLTHKGAIINERKAIRTLAEKWTDEQITASREYLFSKHWRWSKPDNRYTIGAQIILDEIGNVQQILKHPQKPAQNGHTPKLASNGTDYNALINDTSRNYIQGGEEELARLQAQLVEKKARQAVKR